MSKIVDVSVFVLSSDLPEHFVFSQGEVSKRGAVLVRVTTEDGVTGWGECMCHGLQAPQVAAQIVRSCYVPILLGRSIFDVEVLWEEMYNRTFPFGQYGATINAASGVDIALWDALGKTLDQPVHRLIGGAFRTEIVPYATGFYRKAHKSYPEAAIEEANEHMANGFRAMKLKTGFGLDADVRYIRAVRGAVGDGVLLMADFNCAYNVAQARRLLLELEDVHLHFFEELLAPEDMEGYTALRHLTGSYIAAGENIFGKIAYSRWIEADALDILQPDVCSCGGITELKKISAIAQGHHTMLIPHVWGTGVGLAASLQVIASLPCTPMSLHAEQPMLEYDQSAHPFRMELINNAISNKGEKVQVPMSPGIGVDVNMDVVMRFAVD